MQRHAFRGLCGCAALLMLSACMATAPNTAVTTQGAASSQPIAADGSFAALFNQQRRSNGRGAIVADAVLNRAAAAHAADMARSGVFSHQGSGGSTPQSRIAAAGNCTSAIAENIAQGQRSAQEVFGVWMASPSHRRNMMNAKYQRFGLGRSGNYWVLTLAGPCV